MAVRRARYTLIREEPMPEWTMGAMFVGSSFVCHTMEPGLLDVDAPRVAPGFYLLTPHGWEPGTSFKFTKTWALVGQDVSHQPEVSCARCAILIHAGNRDPETRGCILVGMDRHEAGGLIYRSREAMERLRDLIGGREAYLTIMED